MTERTYCSEYCLAEPMAGTAEPVDVWVLLEYKPAWKSRAVEESRLGETTRRWLDDNLAALASMGLKARPQLIRQPEIDSDQVRLLVGTRQGLVRFAGSGYGFLRDINLAEVAADPAGHRREREPHYFVCTNGQRDVCCARFGLPAYAALRERVGERVWQVTHLGGHRFAPNVLVLPQGAVYGRVSEDHVAALVDAVDGGALAFDHLRGRSWFEPLVQAAEALGRRSCDAVVDVDGDETRAAVIFDGPDGRMTVRVRQAEKPLQVLKSCGDEGTKAVLPYLVDGSD